MRITKKDAAMIAGISRGTLYHHIPKKRISVIKDDDGVETIEVSELERVYGTEKVARGLKRLTDLRGPLDIQPLAPAQASAPPNVPAFPRDDSALLRERIKSLEEQKNQLERFQQRERDQFQDEIAGLRENLRMSQESQAHLGRLLTDQSTDQASRGTDHERKLRELEASVGDLTKLNRHVLKQLKAERSKPFWKKLWG